MNKKVTGIFAAICMAAGFSVYKHLQNEREFLYAGTLETTKIILSSKAGTDLIWFPAREGVPVKKGEIIAKLNDDSFRIASAQLNADYKRYQKLQNSGFATKEEFDRIERAKKENDLKIEWCNVRSPIDGIIITKFKEEGEYLREGANIVSISDPYNIWAYFYVPYDMVSKVKVGGKVKGVLQELPERTFDGIILKINEEAEFTPKNVQTREERTRLVYGIKIQFENKDLTLKPGMTMETSLAQQ